MGLGLRKSGRSSWKLTITVFILPNTCVISIVFGGRLGSHAGWAQLTNRENASLNSETCSSVRESACCIAHCQ